MAGIINRIRQLPNHMDFEGQKKAEKIFQTIILVYAVIGIAVGYVFQQFSYTVYILGAGFFISCVLTLPPWPMYRRNPLPWIVWKEDSSELKGKKKK